jgi:hypothetical protein
LVEYNDRLSANTKKWKTIQLINGQHNEVNNNPFKHLECITPITVGSTARVDIVAKRKILTFRKQNPGFSIRKLIVVIKMNWLRAGRINYQLS